MTNKFFPVLRSLTITGSLFLTMLAAHAQSSYYDQTYDGYGYIDTDFYGYPTSGTCDSFTVISSLNYGYSSDTGTYGDVLDAYQSTPGVDGTEYPWSLETIGQMDDGPSCGTISFSWTQYIGHRTTYYTDSVLDTYGHCQWLELACSSGTPTCTGGWGISFAPCAITVRASYLSVRYLGTECWIVDIFPAAGPGVCT